MGNFTELDMYLFGQATHYDIYKKLGAHPAEIRKKKGDSFRCLGTTCCRSLCHWNF